MPRFRYQAISAGGDVVSGIEHAPSMGTLRSVLVDQHLQPLSVVEHKSILQFEITKKRVPRKDLMHFCRQLAVFVRAGMPILEGLDLIAAEAESAQLKRVVNEMGRALRSGASFAEAAAAHPDAFLPYHLGMLESAEVTGRLDEVLERIARYVERDSDARSRLTGALLYPGVVFGASILTVVIMATFVLPRFKTFFASLGAKLPLPTRMLLAACSFVTSSWMFMLVGLLSLGVVGLTVAHTHGGRARFDAVLLKLPMLGPLLGHAIAERTCRILASMIGAGVALPDALNIASAATNNAVYRHGLSEVRDKVLEGQGVAGPLADAGLLTGSTQQILRIGEATGTLDEQLALAAGYYDRELDYRIKRFTGLFEPMVILFVGLIVGFVAVAMVSAIYGIYNQVKV